MNSYRLDMPEDFFDAVEIRYIESLPDGYLFCDILLKLYMKSLKGDGQLMLSNQIPYDTAFIAKITSHKKKTVKKALDVFIKIGIIEKNERGVISIKNYLGCSGYDEDELY